MASPPWLPRSSIRPVELLVVQAGGVRNARHGVVNVEGVIGVTKKCDADGRGGRAPLGDGDPKTQDHPRHSIPAEVINPFDGLESSWIERRGRFGACDGGGPEPAFVIVAPRRSRSRRGFLSPFLFRPLGGAERSGMDKSSLWPRIRWLILANGSGLQD